MPAFRLTLTSVIAITCSLLVWVIFVLPANGHINAWADSQAAPQDWTHWRDRWQWGQTATFVLHFIGLNALVYSIVRETPAG